MSLPTKFTPGDFVKMLDTSNGDYVYGEATICKHDETKVIFSHSDLDYWYYPNDKLEKVSEDEFRKAVGVE